MSDWLGTVVKIVYVPGEFPGCFVPEMVNPIPEVFAINVALPTDGELATAVTSVDPEFASFINPTISVIISDLL